MNKNASCNLHIALTFNNFSALDNAAGLICGRVQRICEVVLADIEQYEPDFTTEQVKARVKKAISSSNCQFYVDELVSTL